MALPQIQFGDNAVESLLHVLNGLSEFTVDLEVDDPGEDWPTEAVCLMGADADGVRVCLAGDGGDPKPYMGVWEIPLNYVQKVTVV